MSEFKKGQTVFVTKYSLTAGIQERVYVKGTGCGLHFVGKINNEWSDPIFSSNDVHATKEDAEGAFYEMQVKKLKSLDKQLKKVSAMKPKFV